MKNEAQKTKKKQNEHKMVREIRHSLIWREKLATVLGTASSLVLAAISILLAIPGWYIERTEHYRSLVPILISFFVLLGLVAIGIQIYNNIKLHNFESDYTYYEQSKKISTALLASIKRTDFDKTCSILQSTYGHVPYWNPINYCRNVLVYDIHQHLRNICIRLKELIISLAPDEFNDDTVTVDIAFTYPSDSRMEKTGGDANQCAIADEVEPDLTERSEWKIITSGDHTSSDNSLHNFLDEESTSFYNYLKKEYYAFYNNKKTAASQNHYIWSKKDEEYERIGSVVGKVIELKNDMPEITYVRVLLTITTYGRRLVEDTDPLDVEKFKHLFTETVMNNYKSLIEAELAQMFIRHGIRDKYIDRRTGKLMLSPLNAPKNRQTLKQ